MAIEKVQQNSIYKGVIENTVNETKASLKEGEQKSTLETSKNKVENKIENKGVKIDTKA